jgi:hypothetical protein
MQLVVLVPTIPLIAIGVVMAARAVIELVKLKLLKRILDSVVIHP